MTELIITNGDATGDVMHAAGFEVDILPWRDVLHEGPLPDLSLAHADDLEQLSTIRAAFLADAFGQPRENLVQSFKERDRALRAHGDYDEVTLWFEHDLYDQLQLLQIMAFFHHEKRSTSLQLVQADDYLGMQTPDGIARLEALKTPVSAAQMALADALFQTFRKPTPDGLATYLKRDTGALPYMRETLRRLFEELPSTADGLSRTQRQALELIEREGLPPKRLFGAVQETEEAMFMGDWSFWRCLEELAFNIVPLIQGLPDRFQASIGGEGRQHYLNTSLTLTDAGRAVLAGNVDHAEINEIDRWLGGTHVTNGALWRWDGNTVGLVPPG